MRDHVPETISRSLAVPPYGGGNRVGFLEQHLDRESFPSQVYCYRSLGPSCALPRLKRQRLRRQRTRRPERIPRHAATRRGTLHRLRLIRHTKCPHHARHRIAVEVLDRLRIDARDVEGLMATAEAAQTSEERHASSPGSRFAPGFGGSIFLARIRTAETIWPNAETCGST